MRRRCSLRGSRSWDGSRSPGPRSGAGEPERVDEEVDERGVGADRLLDWRCGVSVFFCASSVVPEMTPMRKLMMPLTIEFMGPAYGSRWRACFIHRVLS